MTDAGCRCQPTIAGSRPTGDGLVLFLTVGLGISFLRGRSFERPGETEWSE